MLALMCLLVVLLASTQLQAINPLGLLPTTQIQTMDSMFPDSLKKNVESMKTQYDPELLRQTIADYTKPTQPTVDIFLYCNRR